MGELVPKGALLILCFLLGMGGLADHPALACEPLTVKVRPDTSGSSDLQALFIAHQKLQDKLLRLPCLKRIEISGFATTQDVLGGSMTGLSIPVKEKVDKGKVCGEKDEETFLWEDERKQYEKECKRKLNEIAEREAQGLRRKLAQEFSKLDLKKISPRSCVYQAVAWALAEPRSVVPILVTDLKHERCSFPDGPIQPLFGAPPGARPIIIVVPSQGDSDPIAAMDKRMKEIRKRVPTAQVVPYTQIDALFNR